MIGMAVAKKGKRRIVVDGQVYYWFVRFDEYAPLRSILDWYEVYVVSDDRKFSANYSLGANTLSLYHKNRGNQSYVECPVLAEKSFTPSVVEKIIRWGLNAF